jgi:hypothetical protein
MADDKNYRGPKDRTRISLKEDYERRWWRKALGNISGQQLAAAVDQAGHSAAAVRKYLRDKDK